jgi:TonB family protein
LAFGSTNQWNRPRPSYVFPGSNSDAIMGNLKRRKLGVWALALCLAGPVAVAGQQKPDEEEVYEIKDGITPPRVAHQVAPEHPTAGFKISGTVLIGLVVSSHGDPKNVHVVRSLDKDVDQSAVDAVKQWRFEPATKDGKPVAVRVSVEIRFHDM